MTTKTPQQALKEKYPSVFEKVSLDIGPGWVPLIEEALDHLDGISYSIDGEMQTYLKGLVAKQVKEKFGGLRFYYELGDTAVSSHVAGYVSGVIGYTEDRATATCEQCGQCGQIRSDLHWIRALCDEHYSAVPTKDRRSR